MNPKDPSMAEDWKDKSTVIGIIREVLIVSVYSEDGKIIGVPVDKEVREVAGNEVIAYMRKKAREAGVPHA